MTEAVRRQIVRLGTTGRDVLVSSIDEHGFPNTKCMFRCKQEGLRTFYFSTNTSSVRVRQYLANPKACLYFPDAVGFHALMLIGEMAVLTDQMSKDRLWKVGDEMYYPLGVTDPDYCVLKFSAIRGNYYHGSETEFVKTWFDIVEVDE